MFRLPAFVMGRFTLIGVFLGVGREKIKLWAQINRVLKELAEQTGMMTTCITSCLSALPTRVHAIDVRKAYLCSYNAIDILHKNSHITDPARPTSCKASKLFHAQVFQGVKTW